MSLFDIQRRQTDRDISGHVD